MCELCVVGWLVEGYDGVGNLVGVLLFYGMVLVNYFGYDINMVDDDQDIDVLIVGWCWINMILNIFIYFFLDLVVDFFYMLGSGVVFVNQFLVVQQVVVEFVFGLVLSYVDLVFQEIGDDFGEDNVDGILCFFDVIGINIVYGYYLNLGELGGDMVFRNGFYELFVFGSYEGVIVVYEFGYVFGFKYGYDISGLGVMIIDKDSMEYLVMIYWSFFGQSFIDLLFYVNLFGYYV